MERYKRYFKEDISSQLNNISEQDMAAKKVCVHFKIDYKNDWNTNDEKTIETLKKFEKRLAQKKIIFFITSEMESIPKYVKKMSGNYQLQNKFTNILTYKISFSTVSEAKMIITYIKNNISKDRRLELDIFSIYPVLWKRAGRDDWNWSKLN